MRSQWWARTARRRQRERAGSYEKGHAGGRGVAPPLMPLDRDANVGVRQHGLLLGDQIRESEGTEEGFPVDSVFIQALQEPQSRGDHLNRPK